MTVSETLLGILAMRLAVLVLFVATAQALPPRPHSADPVAVGPVAVTRSASCPPAISDGPTDAVLRDILLHD